MAGLHRGLSRGGPSRGALGASGRRTAWLGLAAVAIIATLFLQVVRLSVAEHGEHLKNVERFLSDSRWLPASRGSIRDRNGVVLAADRTSWDVLLQYDAIDGGWARSRARKAALEAVGREAWRELSPEARDAEIDRHEEAFARMLDEQVFVPIVKAGGLTRDEFEARLSAIMTRVERQAVSYRENRKEALRRKYGGDAPIDVIAKERAPSQLDAHVILENVEPETAFLFQQLQVTIPGTVSVEPSMRRVRPFDETKVVVHRGDFPSPVRSSRRSKGAPPVAGDSTMVTSSSGVASPIAVATTSMPPLPDGASADGTSKAWRKWRMAPSLPENGASVSAVSVMRSSPVPIATSPVNGCDPGCSIRTR